VSIEVNNESNVEVDEVALTALGRYVLDALGINPLAELSVVLLDAPGMAALHEQWLDLPGPTDVMAFPMDGGDSPLDPPEFRGPPGAEPDQHVALLGDVVLCPEVAATQARTAGHGTESELLLLCTHGILHLLGYDHATPDDEREMFTLQARLVQEFAKATGREPIRAPLPGSAGETRDTPASRGQR
jgi:probable rRNA maturation factor